MQHVRLQEIRTLGALKEAGYEVLPVKEEMRRNLVQKLRNREEIFSGILGYDDTVIPQIQNAILAKHDLVLLGLRGQAKSRILRMLPNLLDEYVPIVADSEINDDPFDPISKQARKKVEEMGNETPIEWIHRADRYGEKLATPDTTIADLIGDIDPIKAANRRLTYADEEVIHFGIIPRTNRGVFAINELPDLQPRIQVGLFNIMEERDIQIRGFNLRFPLDVMMVYTANPEDYTNRGAIITPLKDRIDSQIITHYPKQLEVGITITDQEAWQERDNGSVEVEIPYYFREIVEQIAFEARESEYIDQKSGVSARLTRSAMEDLISAAERRALLNDESSTHTRISDLSYLSPAITGKVELVYEGEKEGPQNVARLLIGRAVKTIFNKYFPDPSEKKDNKSPYRTIVDWFAGGNELELDQDADFETYHEKLHQVEGLRDVVEEHTSPKEKGELAATMEFVLEALHQHSMLGKELLDDRTKYNDMMGSMLSSLGSMEDEDLDDFDDL